MEQVRDVQVGFPSVLDGWSLKKDLVQRAILFYQGILVLFVAVHPEVAFGDLKEGAICMFEGEHWMKAEPINSLAWMAKHHFRQPGKHYFAVGVKGKRRFQVRYIRPDEIVHKVK